MPTDVTRWLLLASSFKWMQAIAPLETWYRWWGGKEIFHQAPLYPYWPAGLLAVSRGSLRFVLLVQLLVGALQPLLILALGRRRQRQRTGGAQRSPGEGRHDPRGRPGADGAVSLGLQS